MSNTLLSTQNINIENLGNFLAPANGVTHGALFTVTSNNATVQLNMISLQASLGYEFVPQAMTVDNSGGSFPIVVGEITAGWVETIAAGVKRTFQFPAVGDAQFTFLSNGGSSTFKVFLFDFPAFPDSNTGVVSGSVNAVITGQPIAVQVQTGTLTYTNADHTGALTANVAANLFNAASITTGAVIKCPAFQPGGTTPNTFNLWVNLVGATATESEGDGVIVLQPGQAVAIGPTASRVSVISDGALTPVAYRW